MHPETWDWNIGINKYLIGHVITFEAQATDPGSDDLTFSWNWNDGTPLEDTTYFNDGVAPDPTRSPMGTFPFSTKEIKKHTYATAGDYPVTLTVTDDDGESTSITITILLS